MAEASPVRVRTLRAGLLDAAADRLVGRGLRGLRLADAAAAAGVSRQTVYNEFGGKQRLVTAVVLGRTARSSWPGSTPP